ncbi:MAG: hypothetical protein GXW99_05350 [Clostridiales bacterium]|nr:hypothetical protein [Clostridiales bacterium]
MPGEENLIPFSERSKEEAREYGAAGGRASGVARRRKRCLKEAADLYLSLPVSDRRRWNKISRRYVDPEDIDNQMAMIIGLAEAATQGDAKAAKVLIDLIGEDAGAEDAGVQIVDDV